MSITIAEPVDPTEAAPILQSLRHELTAEEVAQRILNAKLRTAIARKDRRPVGAVSFNVTLDVHWHRTLFIHDLITLPDERGAGIGRRLVSFVAGQARQQRCNCVRLCSGADRTDAHRFYRANGFDAVSLQFVMPI